MLRKAHLFFLKLNFYSKFFFFFLNNQEPIPGSFHEQHAPGQSSKKLQKWNRSRVPVIFILYFQEDYLYKSLNTGKARYTSVLKWPIRAQHLPLNSQGLADKSQTFSWLRQKALQAAFPQSAEFWALFPQSSRPKLHKTPRDWEAG